MKSTIKLIIVSILCVWRANCLAGHIELYGFPVNGTNYVFDVYTGVKDKWDFAKSDEPPLAPGKAIRLATKFVQNVPVKNGMKGWMLNNIKLEQMSYTGGSEEWIYVAHFDADPGAVWNGSLPWIEVPVKLDGTVPEPTIAKSK